MNLKIDKQTEDRWVVFYAEDNTLLGYVYKVSISSPDYFVKIYTDRHAGSPSKNLNVSIETDNIKKVFLHAFDAISRQVEREAYIANQSDQYLKSFKRGI